MDQPLGTSQSMAPSVTEAGRLAQQSMLGSNVVRERVEPWTNLSSTPIRIATTDVRMASLYTGSLDARGRLHLEHLTTLKSRWEDFHQTHRPDELGRGPSANAVQRPASLGHESEEMMRRFARDVSEWLHQAKNTAPDEALAVFAAPRFLGFLRDALGALNDGIALYRGEFTTLRANELAAHPTIRLLAQSMRTESRSSVIRAGVSR